MRNPAKRGFDFFSHVSPALSSGLLDWLKMRPQLTGAKFAEVPVQTFYTLLVFEFRFDLPPLWVKWPKWQMGILRNCSGVAVISVTGADSAFRVCFARAPGAR